MSREHLGITYRPRIWGAGAFSDARVESGDTRCACEGVESLAEDGRLASVPGRERPGRTSACVPAQDVRSACVFSSVSLLGSDDCSPVTPPHLGVSPEGLGTSHPWTALRVSLHTRVKSRPVHTSLQTLLSRVGKGVMLTQCVCMSHVPCCTAVALGRTAVTWPDDRATRHQRQASGPLLVPLVTIAVLRESVS